MADSPNFIDYVKICCRAGAGGAGIVHFRHDKVTAKGGPDGGDGGRGGHIILRGNAQLWTLIHLKYTKHIFATDGQNGQGSNKTGADGEDIILEVPLGTVATNAETGEKMREITEDGETRILVRGGQGGKGNWHFRSPTNQTPTHVSPYGEAITEWVILELKVLADVGLVGFPNAGKSTLLSVLSAAKPKIADYPFTTLVPNLGIVYYRDERSFVMADIPGIIEGANEGRGLGHRFLRHIERNATLLFLVAANAEDIMIEYQILLNELALYNEELLDKPRVLAISKCDLIDEEIEEYIKEETAALGLPVVFISAPTEKGLLELKDALWESMNLNQNMVKNSAFEPEIESDLSENTNAIENESNDLEL